MHLNAYRFSIAWPRVIPAGTGAVNPAGLDYYDRLVDALLEAGIAPYATLYHWDLPQALQDQGGWANRATTGAFARYVEIVVSRLGDRVKHWMTHNEPLCTAFLGNETGEHAPGFHDRALALQVAHHVLVSHGLAVPIIRQHSAGAQVGAALNMYATYPMLDTEEDRAAARLAHDQSNRWFLDPMMGRGYPPDAWKAYGAQVIQERPDDQQIIAAPIDFLGLNYYFRQVCHDPSGGEDHFMLTQRDAKRVTDRDWEIYPDGLYDLLLWLQRDYSFKHIYITENGASYNDVPAPDGGVHDAQRIDYLRQHLQASSRAIQAGVPLRGYFCWSLMDNFEWAFGTSSRFGLAYTDFATQCRILKDSGRWYGRIVEANALLE